MTNYVFIYNFYPVDIANGFKLTTVKPVAKD